MNEKSFYCEIFVLDCLRVFFFSPNLHMMTQGMAQQTGRQMGITAAPPYAPLALDSDSDALAECLAANFIFPLDLPPIFFDFFSKVRDCLQNTKEIESTVRHGRIERNHYQNWNILLREHFVIRWIINGGSTGAFSCWSFRCFIYY